MEVVNLPSNTDPYQMINNVGTDLFCTTIIYQEVENSYVGLHLAHSLKTRYLVTNYNLFLIVENLVKDLLDAH